MEEGFLTLLPEDPDASAEATPQSVCASGSAPRSGSSITDTFGRPWRRGLVNVAIGCAGLPALVDLRGTRRPPRARARGHGVALADEVAAASGLVMAKASRVPAAVVRGVAAEGAAGTASRPRPPARGGPVPRVAAAVDLGAADDPLLRPRRGPARGRRGGGARGVHGAGPASHPAVAFVGAVVGAGEAAAPRRDRRGLARGPASATATSPETIERRLARSDAVLGAAPVLIVPWVRFEGSHPYADAERADAEREMFLLSGGAAIQNLLLALHAQGYASCWISSTLFCQEETRAALGVGDEWHALGTVAAGPMPAGAASPRPPLDLAEPSPGRVMARGSCLRSPRGRSTRRRSPDDHVQERVDVLPLPAQHRDHDVRRGIPRRRRS